MSEQSTNGPGHETRDVNFGGLLIITGLTIASGVLIFLGIWWFFQDLRERHKEQMPSGHPLALAQGERLPSPPRLEGIERMNGKVEDVKSRLSTRPNSYGWVDHKDGIVRVPMDRAMTLITEQKLIPSSQERKKEDFDNPYQGMPSPANSGRGAPKEQP
jgi:hypothetical protein